MKTQFFNPDWNLINEAIETGNHAAVSQSLREISKTIYNKEQERKERAWRDAQEAWRNELKALPVGTTLYYNGIDFADVTFGDSLTKIKDNRTRMLLQRNGTEYLCPYVTLQTSAPSHVAHAIEISLNEMQ